MQQLLWQHRVNGNGMVDVSDVNIVINIMLRK